MKFFSQTLTHWHNKYQAYQQKNHLISLLDKDNGDSLSEGELKNIQQHLSKCMENPQFKKLMNKPLTEKQCRESPYYYVKNNEVFDLLHNSGLAFTQMEPVAVRACIVNSLAQRECLRSVSTCLNLGHDPNLKGMWDDREIITMPNFDLVANYHVHKDLFKNVIDAFLERNLQRNKTPRIKSIKSIKLSSNSDEPILIDGFTLDQAVKMMLDRGYNANTINKGMHQEGGNGGGDDAKKEDINQLSPLKTLFSCIKQMTHRGGFLDQGIEAMELLLNHGANINEINQKEGDFSFYEMCIQGRFVIQSPDQTKMGDFLLSYFESDRSQLEIFKKNLLSGAHEQSSFFNEREKVDYKYFMEKICILLEAHELKSEINKSMDQGREGDEDGLNHRDNHQTPLKTTPRPTTNAKRHKI